jgi:hypothetical protein
MVSKIDNIASKMEFFSTYSACLLCFRYTRVQSPLFLVFPGERLQRKTKGNHALCVQEQDSKYNGFLKNQSWSSPEI